MPSPTITQLDPADVAAREELVLVDVREADEREEGRAPASLHIPLGGMLAWEAAGLPVETGPETTKED